MIVVKNTEFIFLRESNLIEGVNNEESDKQAGYAWQFLKDRTELTPSVVLQTHKILMLNQPLPPNERGYYRTHEVRVGGRYGLNYALVPAAMQEWCLNVATSIKVPGKNGRHIKLDHIEFEKIHPFADGNGRVGRMFMNWERLQAKLPILIIYAAKRQAYYKWFK